MSIDTQNNEWRDLTDEEQADFRIRYKANAFALIQTRRPLPTQVIRESGTTEETRGEKFWRLQAEQQNRNVDFWRSIVIEIGEMFGDAAKTSDDGTLQQDVLALKVAPLVKAHLSNATEPMPVDPIAQAIAQMEEAARVLMPKHARDLIMWLTEIEGGVCDQSLAKALGYKSPQQEREEKLKEADVKMKQAKDLFDKANEIEAQAADLIEEAKKLREEATNK